MVIKDRYKEFIESIDKISDIKYTSFQKKRLFMDFLWTKLTRGTYLVDYLQYEFFKRNNYSRNSFIEYKKLHQLIDKVNNKEKEEIFNSKVLFNETFKDYLNRAWLDIQETSFEEFKNFASSHEKIIIKPEEGSFGIGIEIFETKDLNVEDLYKRIKGEKYLVEAVVKQHEALKAFNESTLNTLRMVTMIDSKGVPHVQDAILRIGRRGKHSDNFHNNGLACLVDVKEGIVFTIAKDKDYNRYIKHPDSQKQIIGFQIPVWDKVIERCKELALVVPDVRYVGWDIAIDEDGQVVCIEGNYSADPDASQTIDQIGKYEKYFSLI